MIDEAIRNEATRPWLNKASRDLKAAQILLNQDELLLDVVVFHCQQAAEKALKAYLTWHDTPFGKTHDLRGLLTQCVLHDTSLAVLHTTAEELTPLAVAFRYPGATLEPPLATALDAYDDTEMLIKAIMQRLPVEAHP